jgi:hypothetical protein
MLNAALRVIEMAVDGLESKYYGSDDHNIYFEFASLIDHLQIISYKEQAWNNWLADHENDVSKLPDLKPCIALLHELLDGLRPFNEIDSRHGQLTSPPGPFSTATTNDGPFNNT